MTNNLTTHTKTISLCAFVPYPVDTTPSQRFRIEQWKPHLEKQNIDVDIFSFADEKLLLQLHKHGQHLTKASGMFSAFFRSVGRVVRSKRYDAIFIHRAICIAGPAVLERFLRLLNRPIIFDFDDAIWMLHTSEANKLFGWLKFPKKTSAICRASTHIVVGNQFLADYAKEFNKNVTVVPTGIDIDYYKPLVQKEPRDKVIVGWTGSSTSQTHLEWFAPVLRALMKELDFELRVVSNREPDMPDTPYTWRAWSPETEVKEIGQFDVGIMPMPDDKWSKGKCALKALQCMAMGAATVASGVGANCEVIEHGENGLLALNQEDWHSCLKSVIDNAKLRESLGQAGLKTVIEDYSAKACAEKFAGVVRKVARG